jgi:hypothetical protein
MGCSIIMVEANHDIDMLMGNCNYPDDLKSRVMETHLDNEQAKDFLLQVADKKLQYVFLMHLSEKNNVPALAYGMGKIGVNFSEAVEKDVIIMVGSQSKASDWMIVY